MQLDTVAKAFQQTNPVGLTKYMTLGPNPPIYRKVLKSVHTTEYWSKRNPTVKPPAGLTIDINTSLVNNRL